MKKIIIAIIVILILFFGWKMLTNDKQNVEEDNTVTNNQPVVGQPDVEEMIVTETATEPTNEITVRYTNVGFLPKEVVVGVGTRVTFVNESTSGMWVASDNHPSHTILPSFDEEEAVAKGESYSYIFETPGAWGFHNHVRPSHEGLVRVQVQ